MDLNFSKKTRKIVASLLAVAILLGVLPVSGLTGNSSGAEGNNGSANTIFVKSDHQPVLFDSNGNVKSVLTKKDGTYTGTNVNSSDQIVFLRNDVAKEITVGNTIVFYKKSSNTSTTDDAEPYDRIHVWKENGEPYKEWKSDDAIMKKYSGNLYYYIYPSDKNKVIFHNGLNDDEVGVKKSKEWDLNEWQVYTKNGLAGSLLNTLPTCKVGDNNVFSYYSGKITSEKIEKSDKFGATVTDVAGNESDVFKNDKITFYKFLTSKENSEALIDNVKVNDVDGFKGVVTAQKLKEDCTEVEYTYTYTDNTYGIKFTDTKTVNYTFETPLSVSGKWNVKVNDKEVTVNDKLYYKDETPFNKITVSFDNAKVTYGGKEISGATNDSATEDGSLKSEYFLNDKEVSSDNLNIQTDSNKSEDENILKVKYSYTVNGKTYETFETFTFYCYVDSTAPEITSFEFATVESDVDKVLSFLTFGIYNNDQVVVTVNAEDKNISSGIKKISLYNGDTLLNTQEFGEYISNGSATFTLNKSDELYKLYAVAEDKADNCGKKWTFNLKDHNENCYKPIEYNPDKGNTLPELVSYGGIDKFSDLTVTPENFKHQVGGLFSYKEKGELFNITLSESLSALSEATVTVNKDGSEKEFSDTITFDTTSKYAKKEDCKLDYDLKLAEVFDAIGVSGSDITGNYTITVVATNNAGVSKVFTYDFSIDNTAPKPEKFTISGESATDKILKFLTFGIYSKNSINVKVNANDYNPSSGVKTYTLYELKNDEYRQIGDPTTDGNFTLSNRDEAYKLFVRVTDNFDNTSNYYTFAYTGYEKDSYNAIKSADATEVVRYDGKDKFSDKLTVTPEKFEHHHEKGNLFSYKNNGEFFKIELSESLSALSEATVTVNKDGSEKEFSDTVTFNTTSKDAKKEDCKLDYDLNLSKVFEQIGVKDEAISGKYIITVVATNNAGVSSEPYKYDFSIDNTAPMVTKFRFEDGSSAGDKLLSFLTFGIYHNDAIKVTVSAKDVEINNATSGMDNYEENHAKIELYNGDTAIDGSYSYSYEDGVLSRTFMLSDSENAYQLFAKAGDNFDNVSVGYTFAYTGYEKDSYDAIKSADATEVVSYNGNDQFSDLAVTPENFKHHDENGNLFSYKENEKNDELFNIKLSESLSALSEATVTVNKDGSEKEFSDTITFVTTSKDAKKEDCKLDYDLNLSEVFEQIGVKNEAISGNYTITVVATNNAGVSSKEYTYDFSIDNTAPVITLFAIENGSQNPIVDETSSQEYRYYFQHNTNVTVTAKDSASGVKEIHFRAYDVVKKDNAVDETKTVSSNNNAVFEVPANFKGEIYAYAVDKFDNSSIDKNIQGEGEKKPDDLIVETQQHHNGNASVTMSRAKASYKDNSGLDLYSGNVNARVVFEDAYAGIKDATITVYDYKNDVTGTIYAEIGNDGSIKKTEVTGSVNNIIFNDDYTTSKDNLLPKLVIDYVVTDNSNNIKITTSMTDRAGNKTDNVKDSLSIDKTKPVIDVKYDNNEHTTYGGNDYYKADRTATVTVTERNFDESLVEAAIMRNGGRYTTIGGWTHNNNTADPDKSTHVAKIVYNTDGDFTFDIAVKDKAMNSADKFTQQKFTVDKTAPVIDVSFDNNSAKNGNYYKADRTATIKITEHNFNSGSQYVNIPVTAEGTTAPSVVGWSGSGDDHNATVSFNKDGKYSFTVDYTDLAGNKAVQKKVDSFYIDKTAPEVEITGVADHQAYNGTVAPVVTYRDDNFTDDHDFKFTRIDINSKSDDTSKFDYDTDGNGVTEFIYKYRDFAEVLENDGIYNFTVELSDKAGNSTSKSVTFSVNRFGSTFKASDESEKLIKNGYTNAEQDIVVEEINVSPLTKHSVTLAKSGGNSTELVENTDYKFTSSNNGNEWCKSVYTVNKKNFSDEAAYTVTIMSVDKAKNTNNNRMANSSLSTEQKNKRECAISFVVDKTSPLVSITGIKDNELYKEASKKVKIVCEDDNLDKSKLVVTLDNKKLAEGEDYTIVDDKDGSIAGMLTAEIVLKAETGGIKENLKVTIGDLAGNTGEKSVDNFILSANIFQRFFANPVLVICTFAGLALVIAAVIFFVVKKRKKAE